MNSSGEQIRIHRELGEAMVAFVWKLGATGTGSGGEYPVVRQVATEACRQAVKQAARQAVEASSCWHTLASWTEDGKERIGYFAWALECQRAERASHPPRDARALWSAVHTEADCLFEIGRVHFHEGAQEVDRRFLTEVLPLSQRADALRAPADVDNEDRLEGRIAELLLRLPGEDE